MWIVLILTVIVVSVFCFAVVQYFEIKKKMAANDLEKEAVLQRYAGSNGFIRDTRGNIAITPIGQQRLVSKRMLDKDNLSDKNIIID